MPAERRFLVTRDELYFQVWNNPMSRLARHYGISDVALAKWCKKLNIPRPKRGYWAKKEAGKRVTQAKLPAAEGTEAGFVYTDPATVPPRDEPGAAGSLGPIEDVPVPLVPADLHPLVARIRATCAQSTGWIVFPCRPRGPPKRLSTKPDFSRRIDVTSFSMSPPTGRGRLILDPASGWRALSRSR
jgi:hypothetical protein